MDRGVGSSRLPTRYSRFFRITVPDDLGDGTLEIPQDFVEEHASYLSLSMYAWLQLSTGKQVKVELKWGDGRVWLHKSWQVIIENCSIKDLRTLLFRYEGGSLFYVFIFNKSGLEINHSDNSASSNKRVNLGQPKVTMANEGNGEDDTSDDIVDAWSTGRDDEVLQVKLAASVLAKEGVLQRAKAFQSPNPHFFVIMRSAYHSHLYIPAKPGRCYFYGKSDKSMYLFDPNGRAWFMTYRIGGSPLYQVIINLGWYGFAREHNLQHGDACIFELVNIKAMAFNITIIRLNEGEEIHQNSPVPGICSPRQTGKRKLSNSAMLERAKPLQCIKTSFTLVFKLNTQSLSSLCVPHAHASRYLMDQHENQVYLHGQAGQTWPCKCYVYRSTVNYVRLSTGWKDFVLDNDLQEGDACVFQLLSQAPNHYHVSIVRASASTKPN